MCSGLRPSLLHAALHVGVERLAGLDVRQRGEHHFGGLGGELAAGVGGAGLHDHRPALHRARDVERAAHREVFALVVEHVHLVGVEEHAALDVADEGVVGPAVPQAGDDVVELAGALVALVVLHVLVHAEVERGVRIGGGDDVPAGAAVAQVIERGEAARDVIGRVEGGRAGGDEADALGVLRQRRQQRERLERGRGVAALERIHRHVQHGHVVGHEEGVELGRFESLDRALDVREVEIHVRPGAGIAPGAGVDGGRPHEGVEVELAGSGHGQSPRASGGHCNCRVRI